MNGFNLGYRIVNHELQVSMWDSMKIRYVELLLYAYSD